MPFVIENRSVKQGLISKKFVIIYLVLFRTCYILLSFIGGSKGHFIGVCPKWARTFIEFSKFSESQKSLKHELGSIERFYLLRVYLCG